MKLSLHRVIAEIKHLESSPVQTPNVVFFSPDGKTFQGKPVEDVLATAQGSIDAELAKADRIIKLKVARNKANATTEVVVAGKTMTIDEALATKSVMDRYRLIVGNMKILTQSATHASDAQGELKRVAVEKQIAAMTNAANKPAQAAIDALIALVESQYPGKIFAAPNLSKIEALDKFIQDMNLELDYVLSEINAKTEVEI